jgi:hypothetical protein
MCVSDMNLLADISLTSDQRGWVALAVGVVAIAFLLFRPKFRKKDPLDKPAFSSLSQQRSVERQMQNLLVELSEMTRQMNAQVDTRAAKLEELIRQADQRIATLRDLDGKPGAQGFALSEAPENPPLAIPALVAPPEPIADEFDPRHAEIYSLADQGRDAREIANRLNRPSGEVELILALRPRG